MRRAAAPARAHEGEGEHLHELSEDARGRLVEHIWKLENVELTTVGIDVGSSTSHLMFSGVRLQRKTQALSSQFVVVERKVLWKSPILLTPFLPDGTIDAARLGAFVRGAYREAGLAPDAVDTGAVILTGEAIKRRNARAIAELFAADSGRFVCASAGHHLECALAAHGSGAVALSRTSGTPVLNVDIGGGTTKMALAAGGKVVSTCAFAVGGRLVAFDAEGRATRIDGPAAQAARAAGVALAPGARADGPEVGRVVDALAEVAIAFIAGEPPSALARELLLTEPLSWAPAPGAITFSGGVSEYLHGRETRGFGDIAQRLAARIAAACDGGRIAIPRAEPMEGIRATVIGASQFTVQVSGKTIHVGAGARLPLRNVPVLAPVEGLGERISAPAVAAAIEESLQRAALDEGGAIALAIRWQGDPLYARIRALAEGIAVALVPRGPDPAPLVLMVDGDIGRTLGCILEHELSLGRAVVSIDGVQLREFDFVDIGEVIRPADVVPVVIKSLLFPASAPAAGVARYVPVNPPRRNDP
ncbi:MAG TPA: ethanolamine ammonia-lyase reactivating factor EutA [Usitatibacter sp.]|nr:ethanolamine ammonia-lyase reactivating factor EutA [Usitatibacter sp.]